MDARDRAKLKALSNKVAIIGVGNTPFGPFYRTRDPLRNVYSLGFEAFKNALEDCGARKEDIDWYYSAASLLTANFAVWLV